MENRIEDWDAEEDWIDTPLHRLERQSLRRLCASEKLCERECCLDWLTSAVDVPENASLRITLLSQLARDEWDALAERALHVLGDCAEGYPERTWSAVVALSASSKPSIIELIPAFVLEHILEYHFQEYFPRIQRLIEAGDEQWLGFLKGCYLMGDAESHTAQVSALLERYSTGEPNSRKQG